MLASGQKTDTDKQNTEDTGRTRTREEEELENMETMPPLKRCILQVPTLSECLGKEGAYQLKKEELESSSCNSETD